MRDSDAGKTSLRPARKGGAKGGPPKRSAATSNQKGVIGEAERLAAIVEGSDDAIISNSLDGVIATWNAGATRIYGYAAEEMIGQPIAAIIPFDLLEEEREIIARLKRGERIEHFDTIRLAKDARRVAVSVSVSPLRDAGGNIVGAAKIARDISARRQVEEALRDANEAALQARMEAESANRAKTEFLAVMSHDMRTPLNAIGGFVDLLTDATELTEQQRRYAGLARTAHAELLAIVNDIRDFSDVEAGRVDLDARPFSLTAPAAESAGTSAAEDAGAGKPRILVIDDIDTNREIVEAYLQDHGYAVDCASSGPAALELLANGHYDLILMDIQMPTMDGVAVTRRIRALPSPIRDIPIIAMTGNVLPQQVRSFLEAGMNDHVGKPIERAKLYNNVRRWLPRPPGANIPAGLSPLNFDTLKFEEFIDAIGAEKAERIANKFLVSLTDSFNSTLVETQREAHALINTAGVLGLDRFVEACRRASEFVPSHDPERTHAAIEALKSAQATARQTLTTQLLPKLQGAPLRSTA